MCTLTIVPIQAAHTRFLRLAFSRDESRLRTEARMPRCLIFGGREAVAPIDPDSGGTWIALSSAGLALAIMNVTPPKMPTGSPLHSRGTIIPKLLEYGSLEEMLTMVESLDFAAFAPFRLVLASVDRIHAFEHQSDGVLTSQVNFPTTSLMFTSSGLGDAIVRQPRQELFQEMILADPSAGSQDAFHRHRWADRPHVSVSMARSDARTVSYTTIELGEGQGRLTYFSDSPDQPVQPRPHVVRFSSLEAACS